MTEELNFVKDLAIIMISAGVFTIICRALKQPSILGYLIAGFIISPNLGIFGISSMEAVHQWSEIGMIFIMFGLGLEFSFKKLLSVGSSALTIATSKFIGVFVVGFVVGEALGWSTIESIFLGGLLSMSSTAIIIKTFNDSGLSNKPYATMVFGSLVVEDLIAMVLMVILPTIAISRQFSGSEMLFSIAKLIFFLIIWFLVGIYLIPTILRKAKQYINDEILLIVSIGLCFGMVSLATAVGFSSALGAFVMGSILAETVESEHIDKLVLPIKDMFGALFFVSVGMMISPSVIVENWKLILLISAIVIVFDSIFASLGVILSGGGLENAAHAGFSLANLGEFGFILAGVGVNLGVMREFIYPVIIGVSVLTIFVSPYVFKLGNPTYRFMRKHLPKGLQEKIDLAQQNSHKSVAEKSEWKKLLKAYFIRVLLYGVILIAILMISTKYLDPLVDKFLPSMSEVMKNLISLAITLVAMAPFIYGLSIQSGSINHSASKLIKEKKSNSWPLLGLTMARVFLGISFILAALSSRFKLAGWAVVAIVIAGIIFMLIARIYFKKYASLENQFLSNLNEKDELKKKRAPVSSEIKREFADYDVHIEKFVLSPDSEFVGKKLKDLPFRAESGANIIKVQRGSHATTIPDSNFQFYPYDNILAVGSTKQLNSLAKLMKDSVVTGSGLEDSEFKVVSTELNKDSYLTGKTLRELNLRDYKCMIVSVLRDNQFITNPKPDLTFKEGDMVWIAGETSSCKWLES